MSNQGPVEKLLRDIYARRSAGDMEAIMASFGDNPSFRLAGDEILGVLTTEVRGRDALQQMMQQLVETWDWSQYQVDTVLVDGNRAAVHSRGTMRYVPTGQTFKTETLDLITLEGDKITTFVQFLDTHMAARTLGLAA